MPCSSRCSNGGQLQNAAAIVRCWVRGSAAALVPQSLLWTGAGRQVQGLVVESASGSFRRGCTKIWGGAGCCFPFITQQDTSTWDDFVYISGRRRRCQRACPNSRRFSTSQQKANSRLGRLGLTVLLEDRPATDTGVRYCVSDLVLMTTRDLIGVLGFLGQAVDRRRPTGLELLGSVITLLCDMGMLRL